MSLRAPCFLPLVAGCLAAAPLRAQSPGATTVTVDTSPAGRQQIIDGFGTCLSGSEGQQAWWQGLYFDDLRCTLLRVDLTPQFVSPYADFTFNSPWFHNHPSLPGPENNNVRTYTSAADYARPWTFPVGGNPSVSQHAAIAVMGPDIDRNAAHFNFDAEGLKTAGQLAQLGQAKRAQLGDFKLFGSLWSPAPWLKVSSGNVIGGMSGVLPANGTPWPFIWAGNFAGGRLDTSEQPLAVFDDTAQGGAGPTSALTQFARGTAAYLRGFQNRYGVRFYAVSVQNELNFEEFYNSCTYPLSSQYLAALKRLRAELDRYPDLAGIRLEGPEDLLGGDAYALWQYGGGPTAIHKNLQYLQNIAADPQALAALDFVSIHGYAPDGVNSAGADPTSWGWWANGWSASPAPGIPASVNGFTALGKRSWMTETSGEDPRWLAPTNGFPNAGAFSLAVKLHQALTAGRQSGWAYWQFTDGSPVAAQTLTDATAQAGSPKYVAAKHFFAGIRPGAYRVNATTTTSPGSPLLVSAYVHDADYSLAVVLVNPSPDAIATAVAVPAYPRALTSFEVHTSSEGSLWQGSRLAVGNGQATLTVPGYGVATLEGVGLNADGSSAVGVPAVSRGADGRLQVVFRRDSSRNELAYVVEANDDLGAAGGWTPVATSGGGAPFVAVAAGAAASETGSGNVKTVTVRDAAPPGAGAGAARRFLRVRVTD